MDTAESGYVLDSAALVAPVTALEFVGEEYLLTAEGPVLSVYSLHAQPKLCVSLSVLQNYRIHGVRPRPLPDCGVEEKHDEAPSGVWDRGAELAVFGGKGLRLVTLTAQSPTLQLSGPLMELQDWLLDVRWLGEKPCTFLGVVLAHNTALLLEAKSGRMVRLRSCQEVCLLYSGLLIGSLWDSAVLVGGTVFNQLVLWRPGTGSQEQAAPVERRLPGHSGVIFSLAYLPQSGLLASASDDRSVRVWSLGALGGPGGCGELEPLCQHVLYGHQARVFCVQLAQNSVFSAGEDGACLMWGGDGRVERSFKGHRAGGARALAVSEEQRWVATGGADGGVRVWRLRGHEAERESTEGGEGEGVVDLEFRGEGSPKVVCLVDGGTGVEGEMLVCTDRGRVYLRGGQDWRCVWVGDPEFQSYCVMEVVCMRGGLCVCAVGNLNGGVCVFPLSHPERGVVLRAGEGKVHSLQWVWPGQGRDVCLLASRAEGRVYRWQVGVDVDEVGVTLRFWQLQPFLLPPCSKRWLTAAVTLTDANTHSQDTLWVCGDRRGSLLLYREPEQNREMGAVEESRGPKREHSEEDGMKGEHREDDGMKREQREDDGMKGEAEETGCAQKERGEVGGRDHEAGTETMGPVCVLFGVHGKQGVTSVCECDGLCYSTGRDGIVRVLVVHGNTLTVQRAQRSAKGMEWLERVLFLQERDINGEMGPMEEGEEGMERGSGMRGREQQTDGRVLAQARFALVGFRSASFVVWDPLRQETLLSVLCGGGHRSWGYRPPALSDRGAHTHCAGGGLLVFIRQGAVLAHYPPTQAKSVSMATGQTLREGLHGRGVGCICRLGNSGCWEVLVTGGEDTSLSVQAVHMDTGTVRVLSVITDHISNVRTLTSLRRDGGHTSTSSSTSSLLFSAGGRAQLQCYRLLIGWHGEGGQPTCQVSQITSHRLDEQWERKRNRHKTVKMDPETRYMSMAVVHDGPDRVLLALACSDGAVRLFGVSEQAGKAELLWECFYHQRCVLSIAAHRLQSPQDERHVLVFSGATDGHVCVWDWTSVLALGEGQRWEGPTVPCLSLPIHQSGVNSLAVWEEPEVGSHNERLLSVASGGDDGQLSVLLLRVTFPQCQSEGAEISLELLSHWSEPLAHAAPLTALQVIDRCLIVSTSPDQRVCVWSVCENGSSLRRKGTAFTHTADVAGLEVWRREGETLAAVCGQGLQLLRITSKGRDSERDGQMDTDSRKLQERLNVTYTRNGTSEQTSGEK
ncbi:WD repeat-containing protein 6 [Clupea harengus]|uniref:tRNA (34-2'-O)-methyltransferase regulator WDR6 n=1 Tax=Clupea harengus TaxID=7950 RepID=A0A6P8FGI6_CLUHA|nr:WD repeat-containing protein 6 [Clupea harengus]XP_031422297.1 WD repeat-containing protein 6 [Clupea harengus]